MKKLLLVSVLGASLCSCSLLQRRGTDGDEKPETTAAAIEDNGETPGPLFTPGGQEITAPGTEAGAAGNAGENEVSRLNTKVAALETKIDVLTSNLERLQAQKAQPAIQAEPEPHLAAPVDDTAEIRDQTKTADVSAAPVRPARVASPAKEVSAAADTSGKPSTAAEREFRAGMALFQNGQNLEAASRFALMAKKFPHHLLASHALYWAGEAAARAQQWAIATENWAELEKRYPRSAYVPEALAGLAKAYEAQGDATKTKFYRTVLARSFPKSPVAMKAGGEPLAESAPSTRISRVSSTELAAEPATVSGNDESAPLFEEDKGAAGHSAGKAEGAGTENP